MATARFQTPFSTTSSRIRSGPAARFKVVDRGLGRIALQSGGGYVSVTAPGGKGQVRLKKGRPSDAETFQWTETPYGDLILLSLATHRHLLIEPGSGAVSADYPGPQPDRKDGSCFRWKGSGSHYPKPDACTMQVCTLAKALRISAAGV